MDDMTMDDMFLTKGCAGFWDRGGDFDCRFSTTLDCDCCKYGIGSKNPEAKCNTIKGEQHG